MKNVTLSTVLLLFLQLINTALSMSCSRNCSRSKICVKDKCRNYKEDWDCNAEGGLCPKGFCCLTLDASSTAGTCIQKRYFRLQRGDLCQRKASCDYCQCNQGLVCAISEYYHPGRAIYRCQPNNPLTDQESDCSRNEQCPRDRCCSSKKCKPKMKEGERCYPKNSGFWEANLECQGECEDGTRCARDLTGPTVRYSCQSADPGSDLCR